jgi:hypothetical protein
VKVLDRAGASISSVISRHSSIRTVSLAASMLLIATQTAWAADQPREHAASTRYQVTRTFELGVGRVTRTFTFRERTGVILVNRLTVPQGVRVIVDARIPRLAGARVSSWPIRDDPSLSCQRQGVVEVCNQSAEWCPMPQATWHFQLIKLAGPAEQIRFDYVVASPPAPG